TTAKDEAAITIHIFSKVIGFFMFPILFSCCFTQRTNNYKNQNKKPDVCPFYVPGFYIFFFGKPLVAKIGNYASQNDNHWKDPGSFKKKVRAYCSDHHDNESNRVFYGDFEHLKSGKCDETYCHRLDIRKEIKIYMICFYIIKRKEKIPINMLAGVIQIRSVRIARGTPPRLYP